jgi:hypothetical protein
MISSVVASTGKLHQSRLPLHIGFCPKYLVAISIARLNELYNSGGTEKIKVRTQQLQAKDFSQTSIIR